MPANTWLGLPPVMDVGEAQRLEQDLATLWRTTIGPIKDLDSDLKALKRYFDPVAAGRRLRVVLADLPKAPKPALGLGPPLVLPIDSDRVLPTPEGRIALDILRRQLMSEPDVVTLSTETSLAACQRLVDLYRGWSRHRLTQTLALLAGDAEPLRLPAVGLLLTLLANRNVGPARAMPVADATTRDVVETALLEPAAAFAAELGADRLKISKESLYRGWMLHEISRRLPEAIDSGATVAVVAGQEIAALELAARELARRDVDAPAVAAAYDLLTIRLREHLPVLAAYGLAYERAPDTRRLREDLLERFDAASERARAVPGTL